MNYIELAHRTSAPVGPARERLNTNHVMLSALYFRLIELHAVCKELDTLKRVIFYGQKFEPDKRNMPTECEDSARHGLRDDTAVELLHAGLGLATEGGEFLQALFDHLFEGLPLDKTNLQEEVGDVQWYVAKVCRALGTTIEVEQNRNIAKLAQRYGSKFSDSAALLRDLDAERAKLEEPPEKTLLDFAKQDTGRLLSSFAKAAEKGGAVAPIRLESPAICARDSDAFQGGYMQAEQALKDRIRHEGIRPVNVEIIGLDTSMNRVEKSPDYIRIVVSAFPAN